MQVGGWLKASKTCIQADETHLQTYLHAAPSYLYARKWPIVCFANKLHFSWNTEVMLMNNTCLIFLIINGCSYKDLTVRVTTVQLFLNCAGILLSKSKTSEIHIIFSLWCEAQRKIKGLKSEDDNVTTKQRVCRRGASSGWVEVGRSG